MRVSPQKETNMNSENIDNTSERPNEAYNAWQTMTDEVVQSGSEKAETDNGYTSESWASFEVRTKNPEETTTFQENMSRLDKRTRNFLNNLPGNIDQIFGVNSKSYEMLNKIQSEIISRTIAGSYNHGEHNGENLNLYMNNEGALYNGIQAADARKKDNANNSEAERSFEDIWSGWLSRIEDQNDREQFATNMQKLDERTQKYLCELPGNIDCVFGVNKDSYALLGEVQNEIINKTVSGRYTPDRHNGENWNLYLTKDGELYCDSQAAEHRRKDGVVNNSEPQSPTEHNAENSQTAEAKAPEDFGFREW